VRASLALIGRIALFVWFVAVSVVTIGRFTLNGYAWGYDARVYHEAAKAGDLAYVVSYHGTHFAGPPPTLLPFVLTSWLPQDVVAATWLVGSLVAAVWALRRIGMPLWWLAFPPVAVGIWGANPNLLVLALLVGGVGGPAVLLKVYAALPLALERRWRELVVGAGLVIVTAPLVPWSAFLSDPGGVVSRLGSQSPGLSGWPTVEIVAVLILVGLRGRAWWSVPVAWPSTQLHYGVLALPAITPLAAIFLAVPIPLAGLVAGAVALVEQVLADAKARDAGRVVVVVGVGTTEPDDRHLPVVPVDR
jgi:hypothetical protein